MFARQWCDIKGIEVDFAVRHRPTAGEKRMKKFTIRLLTLAIFATPLTVIPRISPADAATNGKTHVKKHAKRIQRAPAVQNANKSSFPSYENDFDRRNAGGGGGY
jgi:hypothetical protein